MSNRPLESWIRDAIYDDPTDLFNSLGLDPPDDGYYRWKEFVVDCGRIDLVFAWREVVVIVEVKRDCADEGAVAQILRYAGALLWVNGQKSYKVVAACDFTNGARYAAFAADVELIRVAPAVRLEPDEGWLPSDRTYYAELGAVVWPVATMPERVGGPSESRESSDDTATPVRRDADGTKGASRDFVR